MDSPPTFAVAVNFSVYSPPLYAIVLTPQGPIAWPLKVDFLRFCRGPCLVPCLKVHQQEKKQEDFSFLSSMQPQIFPIWYRYKKPLLTLYMQVILLSVGIAEGTIKGIINLYNHSQYSPYSCSGVRKMNDPVWQWNMTLVSHVFYGSHPSKSSLSTWQSLLKHTEI